MTGTLILTLDVTIAGASGTVTYMKNIFKEGIKLFYDLVVWPVAKLRHKLGYCEDFCIFCFYEDLG